MEHLTKKSKKQTNSYETSKINEKNIFFYHFVWSLLLSWISIEIVLKDQFSLSDICVH